MLKRMWCGVLAGLLLALGGCGPFSWGPPAHLPEEPLPGWAREVEAGLYAEDLPPGSTGGLAGLWGNGAGWLWCLIYEFPNPEGAHTRLAQEVAALSGWEEGELGDEGVGFHHPDSGLSLELFRLGAHLLLVGSLADDPAAAPTRAEVREAARAIASHIPSIPAAEPGPPPNGGCTPPEESPQLKVLQVPLSLAGSPNGELTLVLEIVPLGAEAGLCRFRFNLYLKCVELGPEDGDPGLLGPGDLFLAGSLTLPCGELTFLTEELAQLNSDSVHEFPENGVLIASQECLAPCGLQNFPIVLQVILRNHNRVPLLDLLAAAMWALRGAAPQAQPQWETAVGLSRTYGPQPETPEDPEAAAAEVPGTSLGKGTARTIVDLLEIPGFTLHFEMRVVAHGECWQKEEDTVHCRVVAGEAGQAQLTAWTVPSCPVGIFPMSLPPWASCQPVTGYGQVETYCNFTPPMQAVGRSFRLHFRAYAFYAASEVFADLQLLLDVVAPEEPG
ncbi:TPA: hypothetical protein EYH33_00695 [Candidatus Bipolaricaulota bacterium]|nr:hypothetical protein [Candidatus Bipolaricaulota bacterium]